MANTTIFTVRELITAGTGQSQSIFASGLAGQTPVAAIGFMNNVYVADDPGISAGAVMCVGLFDGTDQGCSTTTYLNSNPTSSTERQDRDSFLVMLSNAGADNIRISATALVPGGVELLVEVDNLASDRYVTITFIGPANIANVKMNGMSGNIGAGSSAVPVGFEPHLVFGTSTMAPGGFNAVSPSFSSTYGVAINNGAVSQRGTSMTVPNNQATSQVNAFVHNNAIWAYQYGDSAETRVYELGNFSAAGFDIIQREGTLAGRSGNFLSIAFIEVPNMGLYDVTIPGGSGDVSVVTGWNALSAAMSTIYTVPTYNTQRSSNVGAIAHSAITSDGDFTTSVRVEDAQSSGSTDSMISTKVQSLNWDGASGNVIYTATSTLGANGVDLAFTQNPTVDCVAWMFVMGETGGAPPVGVEEMYVKDGGVLVKGKPYIKNGGVLVAADAYVKEGGAWVPVYET